MAKHSLSYVSTASGSSQSKPQSQMKLDSMLKHKKCPEARAKAISDRILYMICADLHPVRMVKGSGFKSLIEILEPGYTIPSRKYFSNLLQAKYDCCKEVLRVKLEEETSIALTTDIWTSRAVEAYITVTCHYLEEWALHSYVLTTCSFPERHTGIEIASKLQQIVDDFKIASKVSVVVHDQAANMLCMVARD
ncbi:PREDICTED: zinc finger BED domain-containing protein 1-like [Amphimedon queenslandica]|uniref:DUF659 domain-containing protein n=1 Tax=Amphimedon queenslandica TaxID=400682 RepID=A0A1X7TXW3_AMPQE|nr:PREDICTED: zinc finger BED domain-containing protein 1-like [Amphimedon queenslandica]|eukprot:XP_011406557.1 PREDICTED: zinc finger BED domain-containing protein 1-like [Amphimedon queenslandica]